MKIKNVISWFFSRFHYKNKIKPHKKYRLGIKPDDIDDRDYVKLVFPKEVALPVKIDYSDFVDKKYQGTISSCGSFAAVTGLELIERLNNFKWQTPLSERYHYWMVRQRIDDTKYQGTFPTDSGQTGRNAMKVLQDFGTCPESLEPYDDSKYNDTPTMFSSSFANFWKIGLYERSAGIDGIKAALYEKKAVWLGIPVQSSIFNNSGEIIIWKNENIIGGHAITVVGYDDDTRTIKVANWWENWGENGFGYTSYDYFEKAPWYDIWVYGLKEDAR